MLSELATLKCDLAFEKERTAEQHELREQMLEKLFKQEHSVQNDLLDLRHSYESVVQEGVQREQRSDAMREKRFLMLEQRFIEEKREDGARIAGYQAENVHLSTENHELKLELSAVHSDVHMLQQQIGALEVELETARLTAAVSPHKLASAATSGPTSLSQPGGVRHFEGAADDAENMITNEELMQLQLENSNLRENVMSLEVLVDLLRRESSYGLAEKRDELVEDLTAYSTIMPRAINALTQKAKLVGVKGELLDRTDWTVKRVVKELRNWDDKRFADSVNADEPKQALKLSLSHEPETTVQLKEADEQYQYLTHCAPSPPNTGFTKMWRF